MGGGMVEDAVADLAIIFHWPPSELWAMDAMDLAEFRRRAIERHNTINGGGHE